MAVRIPIEADAQHVLSVFEQIRRAIRETGQEGVRFQDLDLSHPELAGLANVAERLQQRFEELGRVGRGATAAAVRNIRESAPNVFDWVAETERVFPDAADLARHRATVGKYIFRGTEFERSDEAPPPPAPAPGPGRRRRMSRLSGVDDDADDDDDEADEGGGEGDDGEGGGGGKPRRRRRGGADDEEGSGGTFFEGTIKSAAKFALGAAGLTGIAEGVASAYSGAQHEDVLNDQLYRRIGDTGTSFDALRQSVRALADGIDVTTNEAQGLAQSWARLTSETSSRDVIAGTELAGRFARGYGVDKAGVVDTLARARVAGEDPRDFAVLIAEAVREGGRDGSFEETSRALLRWTETASRTLLDHSNVGAYAASYAALNSTGLPGLRGEGAEQLLGQVDRSIQGGGSAGIGGTALLMRGFARLGITDPYQLKFQLEGGAFERVGKDGPTNFQVALGELMREYPGNKPEDRYRREAALGSLFGISMRQAEALQTAGSSSDMLALNKAAAAAGVGLRNVDPSALPEMARAASGGANLTAIAKGLLARKDLDPTDVVRLQRGENSGNAADLLSSILQVLGNRGGTSTTGNLVQGANAHFSNQLQEAAQSLVVPLSGVKDNLAALLPPITHLADVMSAEFVKATNPADLTDSKRAAEVMADTPGALADMLAAMKGDTAAQARLQSDWARAKEGALQFVSPGAHGGLTGRPELAPDIAAEVRRQAALNGIPVAAGLALARTESGGYDLRSPAGAIGTMQLTSGTAADMGVTDIHDWHQNVAGGFRYLSDLIRHFNGNVEAGEAAYNAGPNNPGVLHFAATGDESELPRETQQYLTLIRKFEADYQARLNSVAGGQGARHELLVAPIEVHVRQPDGSTDRKTAPATRLTGPVPSGGGLAFNAPLGPR